uniref:Uncharacterized protein n=1 Tax=Timema monikensis TaxID=170555 RepID=A0A7R9HMF0_9NEOP|nr:unnamed protein product [Timema monikensis]
MERRRTRRYHHREKTWMEKFKDYLRQFIAFLFSNVGIIGLVVGYTITGAFIFIFIEKKEVSEGNIIVMKLRNETVDFLWNLTYVLNVFDEPHWKTAVSLKLMDYQEEVVKAISKGFDGSDNNLGSSQWSFSGAFLYSLTVITTIGRIGVIDTHADYDSFGVNLVQRKQSVENTSDGERLHRLFFACENVLNFHDF